jgi:hypothetical protein
MNTKNKVLVLIGIVLILFVTGGIFFWQLAKLKPVATQKLETPVPVSQIQSQTQVINQPVATEKQVAETPKLFKNDIVRWNDVPQAVTNIKIFKGDYNFKYKIWNVGEMKDTGDKIFLVIADTQSMEGSYVLRFREDSLGKLYLMPKYSSPGNFLKDYSENINDKTTYDWPDISTVIPSLEFPGVVYAPAGQQLVKKDDFPEPFGTADNEDGYLNSLFFNNLGVKPGDKAFSDPILGDFYFFDDKSDFIVKAPDGTYKKYAANVEIMGEKNIPKVTWSDGTANISPFTYNGMSGCGIGTYADVIDFNNSDSNVKQSDLIEGGKANGGKTIYILADKNHAYLKKWYQENMDIVKNYDGDSGLPFKKTTTYDQFTSNHLVFFWQDSFGRWIRFINTDYVVSGGCGKPVIYLYPEKTENISVNITPTGGMSASKPAYNQGWNVTADPQSNITNLSDGKTYPYLFWEGRGDSIYQMPQKGFVTSKENLENLLNGKLALFGLNEKEISDFKEFWLPKMLAENKSYYFVTFVSRRVIDKLAPLEISPRPDTVIRVLMDYRGLDQYENVPGFSIPTPERKGFTAIEWGGVLK